jgi:hypothetical protein
MASDELAAASTTVAYAPADSTGACLCYARH